MFVHVQLGFFREALNRRTSFVNHQRAPEAQRHYRRTPVATARIATTSEKSLWP
jgi:hypothetical protein